MINQPQQETYQVQILDPLLLSGTSISELIKFCASVVSVDLVMLWGLDLVAATDAALALEEVDKPVAVSALLERLTEVIQVVWGWFYFFCVDDRPYPDRSQLTDAEALERSRFMIEAADNMRYYIRTANPLLAQELSKRYPDAKVTIKK